MAARTVMAMGAAVARIIFAREMKSIVRLTIALPAPPSAARLTGLLLLVSYGPLARGALEAASRGDRRGINTTCTRRIDAAAASVM